MVVDNTAAAVVEAVVGGRSGYFDSIVLRFP